MRTKREQVRKSERALLRTPTTLNDFGPDAFPKKFPDMECVQVYTDDKHSYQYLQSPEWYESQGYEVLSTDVKDTGRKDLIWMGKSKKLLQEERELADPRLREQKYLDTLDTRGKQLHGFTTTDSSIRLGDIAGQLPNEDRADRVRQAGEELIKDNPDYERILEKASKELDEA